MKAKELLIKLGVKPSLVGDKGYLEKWCQYVHGKCPDDAQSLLSKHHMYLFEKWLVTHGSMKHSSARTAANRIRHLVGKPSGIQYFGLPRETVCPCGGREVLRGGLMCQVCQVTYRQTLARQQKTPLGALRKAVGLIGASALATYLKTDARGVWLKFVARSEVSPEEGALCARAILSEQRAAREAVRVEDFLYHRTNPTIFPALPGL